jgi:hypothetical protein
MAICDTKLVKTCRCDTEEEANSVVDDWKNRATREGFTITKTKVDYKTKKDRKTGEITEEWWMVEVTISYEI